MSGGIFLRILTKKNGYEEHVHAEMKERGIKMTKKMKKELTIAEKRKLLRKHEMERIIKVNPDRAQEGIKESDIQFIEPQSEMLKGFLFDDQQAILDS